MPRYEPRGIGNRALSACFSCLAGALAVFVAVKLIAAVIVPLLILAGTVAVIGLGTAYFRGRNRHW